MCITKTYETGVGFGTRKFDMYELDKDTTLTLLLGYDVVARMKVVKRWQELEAKNNKPLTRKEMALMVIAQEEEIERLQIELDQSKQWLTIKKVAAHNNLNWKSLEWRKLKATSEVIGLIPKKIFDANFPDGVNVYHKDAWRIVYPNLALPNGEV
jgi:phage regulator Rha-like protein